LRVFPICLTTGSRSSMLTCRFASNGCEPGENLSLSMIYMFEHWLFQRRKQGLTREGKSKSRPALVAFNSHGKRISVQKRIENEVLLQPRNNERRKNKRDISTDSTRSPLLLRKLWLGSPSTNLVCVLLSAFGLWALSSNSSQNSHGQVGRQDRQASLPSSSGKAINRASRET